MKAASAGRGRISNVDLGDRPSKTTGEYRAPKPYTIAVEQQKKQ